MKTLDKIEFEQCKRTGPFWQGLMDRGCIIKEAATESGAILSILTSEGSRWLTGTNIAYPFCSSKTQQLVGDKMNMYALASDIGLDIPQTYLIRSGDPVDMDIDVSRYIVKPNDSFGSRGLSLSIFDRMDLEGAIKLAQDNDSKGSALLQEKVMGDEYRFTVLGDEVVSVLKRVTARVTGDGTTSIAELIDEENIQRESINRGLKHIKYPAIDKTSIFDSVDLRLTPLAGEVVIINQSSMVRGGASVYEVEAQTHLSYKELALRLARAVGANFLAVDIFIQDIINPAANGNYFFNEANASPALRLYYAARNQNIEWIPERVIDNFIDAVNSIGRRI